MKNDSEERSIEKGKLAKGGLVYQGRDVIRMIKGNKSAWQGSKQKGARVSLFPRKVNHVCGGCAEHEGRTQPIG